MSASTDKLPDSEGPSHDILVGLGPFDSVLAAIGALVLFSMMLFTSLDVFLRYLFNAPLPGGFEITELMMATLIFTGLPIVSKVGRHIVVDLLDNVTPRWLMVPQRWTVDALSSFCLGIVAWRLWVRAEDAVAFGDTNITLRLPMAPFIYYMAALTALAAVTVVIGMARRTPYDTSRP